MVLRINRNVILVKGVFQYVMMHVFIPNIKKNIVRAAGQDKWTSYVILFLSILTKPLLLLYIVLLKLIN